jgi:biotin carboxyl carrier protein
VLFNEQHVEVDVVREGGGFRVTLEDGHSAHIDAGMLADGHAYSLLIDDRSVDVAVEESPGNRLEVLISGRRYSTEVLGEREWLARSIQGEAPEGDRSVRAVMTGVVRDVLVQPGDSVARGQTLFILEAMKMENEVKAERDGRVARVAAASGQSVTIGDVVVEIE